MKETQSQTARPVSEAKSKQAMLTGSLSQMFAGSEEVEASQVLRHTEDNLSHSRQSRGQKPWGVKIL